MSDNVSPPRWLCYLDEAGDSGGRFGEGSSEFLAIGATFFLASQEADMLTTFDEARAERERIAPFRKFSKSNPQDNFVLTSAMARKPMRLIMVSLHKPSMDGSYVRSNPQSEYQYLVKFAVERVSWLARDAARGNVGDDYKVQLIFSEQKVYPYPDLCEYLNRLESGQERYNCSIEWKYIHPHVLATPHEDERPIHLADIAASAFHKAIEPKKHGMTDDRFLRNLFPILYRRANKCYGLKMFPGRTTAAMRQQGKLLFLDSLP